MPDSQNAEGCIYKNSKQLKEQGEFSLFFQLKGYLQFPVQVNFVISRILSSGNGG